MKKLSITIAAISMLTTSTVAGACADLQGFYAGANIGLGTYKSSWTDHSAWIDNFAPGWTLGTVTTSSTGFTGGAQGGYNFQQGCALFGVEMDANMANFDSTEHYVPATGSASLTLQSQLNWYTTVRARAGVIVDSLMLYVTGGLAYANNEQSWSVNDPLGPTTEQFSKNAGAWGMTGGVGMEWALSPSVSLTAEGLYLSFVGDETTGYSASGNQNVLFDTDYAVFTGRIGANVKF